ncbi:MAG: NifB/NifX family molybdenum-iron cluster-binding protein [Chloroflexi bacterium]|nr:NifB/NifX family molybdenum-iron cluster-binding protein [Chloroflexota bacterium]
MKIAAVTDDGMTICQHFGRAPLYVVVTVEDGKVVSKETRPKAGHHTFALEETHTEEPGQPHGYDAASQSKHAAMASNIADCQVLLAGGMGWGAYESLQSYKIEAVVTDVVGIDEAVAAYLDGSLPNLFDRLH